MNTIGIKDFAQKFNISSETKTSGGNMFHDIINDVIQSQNNANDKMVDFMNGKETEIHEVIIASEKAKTNLQLLVELRNKTVDMYKELTRIQV